VPSLPGMLLDLLNRGQLASGFSTFNPDRAQLLDTYKDVGTVSEVFRTSHPGKHRSILGEYAGRAGIGHTRYATSGAADSRYAQPFERHHARPWKWFSFAFNGQLANYAEMKRQLQDDRGYHFSLGTDTEIIMHALAHGLRGERKPSLKRVMGEAAAMFDGAYNIAFLDALGRMFVARDPMGIRPMHWAVQGQLFGAASESVALTNAGFEDIRALEPGQMVVVEDSRLRVVRYASVQQNARCFLEWVYFSNVASQIDGMGVYQSRAAAGERLAACEDQFIDEDSIVVPVPDTAKAAGDAFAYHLGIPCMEGLIRNRYVGRTFIQPDAVRQQSAQSKYTPLPSVLEGKRVFLVEDSIVRSLTLKTLVSQLRSRGGVREVHVRVACPPIVAPCFYGIDMSTLGELFAPKFLKGRRGGRVRNETLAEMARALGVDSLRYLDVADLAETIGCDEGELCLGCVTGRYPTEWGGWLLRKAKRNVKKGLKGRTYG
ncbi:MAG: amidophosphoribosyltransferase, partial [Gemmatimonadetes bacterium]|nr:amidophosphoribosyltransferase [Gemmatimonadota bacterium]